MDPAGKAAIITGGGTGVGAAAARQLAELGCHVLVNYSRSRDAAEAVAKDCENAGVKAVAVQADVAVDADCVRMVDAAMRAFGRLDILLNNAGTTTFIPHDDLDVVDDAVWDSIMAVNLKGPFQCTRAARTALAADGGGEIVMTSSVAGLIGTGSSIPYCASKAALNNLTVTLARVLGPDNIRVNGVAPGFIDGAWLQQGLGGAFDAVRSAMEQRAPLGRVCTPDEVALAILGIVRGSDLTTGHVLPVEGGMIIGTR